MISEGKLLFILAAIIAVASAKGWWETGISFDLNSENWAEHVGKDKTVIVEFYATYCGYCRKMQGQWDVLAEHYMGDNTNRKDVLVAKIDGERAKIIPQRFNVHSYPTILIWKKGEIYPAEKFYGARTFDSFRDWIERIAGPEVKKEENIKQEDVLIDGLKDERMLEIGSQDLESIAQKLELLLRVVNSEKNDMGDLQLKEKGNDVDNMKMILNDISSKINGRKFVDDEINFAHGVCFMMIGLFIGVGVSFTAINYKKLGKKKLSTKV